MSAGYIFKSLKPLADRVLVEKSLPSKKSIGGIVLPDSAQSKTNWGIVRAVGPGTLLVHIAHL
jgi:chaperonin GroES